MSLLMDALKRAEESKQDAVRSITGPAVAPLSLEPLPKETPSTAPPPTLAPHLDAVDSELAASTHRVRPPPHQLPPQPLPKTVPPTAAIPSVAEPAREAVRNAFAAKEPEKPSRGPLWLALGILGVAGVSIAVYVWFQINHIGGASNLAAPASPTTRVAAAPRPDLPSPPPPASPSAPTPAPEPAVGMVPPSPAPELFKNRRDTAEPKTEPSRPDQEPPTRTAIRLQRTHPEADPSVSRGYQSLQSASLDRAQHDYNQALNRDPKNVDALLGLATIAQRQGRVQESEGYYRRALESDPKDTTALAAVIAAAADSDPVGAESRLKFLLSAQPDAAALHFALGNLLARQNRWPEAQQSYFNATTADGDNPDYLFNLAVSLDHLRQPTLAARHYRLALEAAERRPAAFDREGARKRLQVLQP